MFILIKDKVATMYELKNCYTLSEALKLFALVQMEKDIEMCRAEDMKAESERRR